MRLTLSRYYQAVDAGDLDAAMALVAPDVQSALHLPSGTVRGRDRAALRNYLSSRPAVDRRHIVLTETREGDLEFTYGRVEDDGFPTGHLLAVVRIDDAGLIASYQVSFDTDLVITAPERKA